MRALPYLFIAVDGGFILYWLITVLHVIPAEHLFNDYDNPLMVAWNWSFLPIDLAVSVTGVGALSLRRKGIAAWERLATVSLVFTTSSGLMAISFWAIVGDYNLSWWAPNLFLLVYPWFFLPRLLMKA
ncbi:DUF5360 family protein [Sorangium atrum]|uniref:DUF5360 family protein n=1 Tax=Sorangium atrum TaxID=2995308 RepID=A0ABT5C3M8_9BACT|nr:DUF5360 family protein [Sorangium aterium]MDC0681020.1 DUF5360 family protein [Sorangium aterium]